MNTVKSKWWKTHKSLKDFYASAYNSKFYKFDKLQLTIDPHETLEDFNSYSKRKQEEEIEKCKVSFAYFCQKYVKVKNPRLGLVPFVLENFKRKLVKSFKGNKYTIIKKFRQGGFTTTCSVYGLWTCLFNPNEYALFLSKTDREAVDMGMIFDEAIKNFPSWLDPRVGENKWNEHEKRFNNGSCIVFRSLYPRIGRQVTFMVIDEAAFATDMENHWAALYPTLANNPNSRCIVNSTFNGNNTWHEKTFQASLKEQNRFNSIQISYRESPEWQNNEAVKQMRNNLGEKAFLQEFLCGEPEL